MNDNDKLDLDHEYSWSEDFFKYDDIFFCNDILSATDDFSWTKYSFEAFQKRDFLMIDDPKKIIRNRYQLYVGNLTKWTTDQDIYDCITSIGVSDLIDVKFFENDISGQSKGFCIITLHSEYSVKLVLNILPKEKLYGKSPIVTHMSIEAYSFLDTKSKTWPIPSLLFNQNLPDSSNKVMQESLFENPLLLMQQQNTSIPIKGLREKCQATLLLKHDLLSFDVGNHSSNLAYNQDTSMQGHQLPKYALSFSDTPASVLCKHNKLKISPRQINEIMKRNRIISSSAIARAITNTGNGEFSDAMETLMTAIMLIKESKVANYEGSDIIVRSLQDVLHIIEIKSYQSRKEKSNRKKKIHK